MGVDPVWGVRVDVNEEFVVKMPKKSRGGGLRGGVEGRGDGGGGGWGGGGSGFECTVQLSNSMCYLCKFSV